MRYDLDHEVRPSQRLQQRRRVDFAMLEAHCGGDAEHRAVVQGADHHVSFVRDLRARQLLGEATDLAPTGDRRIVVEVHRAYVTTFLDGAILGLEAHWNNLTRL